jgi:hypothetical protein
MDTKKDKYYYSKSKRFAVGIFVAGVIISMYSVYKELAQVAIAIGPSFTGSAVALYINKQFQDRKKLEINNN